MAIYKEITFRVADTELQQMLIAQLSEAGIEGFEENETELLAFVPQETFDPDKVKEIADRFTISFTIKEIKEQNWNAIWESNFDPVVVDDFVAIRAGFHEPQKGVELEIVITPKMSFGTGHHATTYMMMRQMRTLDFAGKKVFDFGTGTGVLAILAEKRGAADVFAIDYDDWSIENAAENCQNNECTRVRLQLADNAAEAGKADIILANINKHVILENLEHLKNNLNDGGIMLLSGLLTSDEEDIVKAALPLSLHILGKEVMNNWICLVFGREI